jgi:hypothetical protein
MSSTATPEQVRLLHLLEAADVAGLTPLDVGALHGIAYFANVLSPVWHLPSLDGKVLKTAGGPFYPNLQRDLDRLVGRGLVIISSVGHRQDDEGRWKLMGTFELHWEFARPVLDALAGFDDERHVRAFIQELAMAISVFSTDSIGLASEADPTFGDPLNKPGNVVDFGEWQRRNHAVNAARMFRMFAPHGVNPTDAELLHLYLRHLESRLTS